MNVCQRSAQNILRTAVLLTVLLTIVIASSSQFGVVNADALRLRAEPNLTSPLLALMTPTEGTNPVPQEAEDIETLFSQDQDVVLASATQSDLLAYVNTGSSTLNVRSGPGTTFTIVDQVASGNTFPVVASGDGWYEISYQDVPGFLCSDYVLLMTTEEYDAFQKSSDYLGAQLANTAQKYLGCKYVYGANGPSSFDCSGFTKYICAQFGISINRTATDQLQNGISVEKSELQAGDLVFFRRSGTVKPVSHVGLYIGDGSFIHASTNQYAVRIDTLASGYYSNILVAARRVV